MPDSSGRFRGISVPNVPWRDRCGICGREMISSVGDVRPDDPRIDCGGDSIGHNPEYRVEGIHYNLSSR